MPKSLSCSQLKIGLQQRDIQLQYRTHLVSVHAIRQAHMICVHHS